MKENKELLSDLNPEQKEAVTYQKGPLLIVAGAGTGKTTVITRRIAWLILEKKAGPDEILAVTFTDKAAGEMEERVDKLLPYGYVDLWISTFHSFGERILHDHALEIGLPDNFKLLNQTEQALLIRQNFDRFELDYYRPLGNPTKFIQALVKHFSRCKDEIVSPENYLAYLEEKKLDQDSSLSNELLNQETLRLKEIAEAYHTYQQLLLEKSALDFGDLINYTLKLFKERPLILEKYRQKFKYILVDEFQDTNYAQYELIKLLAEPRNNLTVCFDDDQSIYKFRGASVSNVLQFKKDFPESQEVSLIKNYRSTQDILDLSYNFIQLNNPNRLEFQLDKLSKKLVAQKESNGVIECFNCKVLEEEVEKVAKKIIELKSDHEKVSPVKPTTVGHGTGPVKPTTVGHGTGPVKSTTAGHGTGPVKSTTAGHGTGPVKSTGVDHGVNWNDFAILIRANSQADTFIQALAKAGIPYQFLASAGLYVKPIILDIIAYLKLLDDYHESVALYRILNSPVFEIDIKDIMTLNHWARRKSWSLYETLQRSASLQEISQTSRDKIVKLLGLVQKHTQQARNENVGKIIFSFLEDSGYLKLLAKEENQQIINNITWLNQFFKKIEEFEAVNTDKSLKNFREMIELAIESGDMGSMGISLNEEGPDTVKILTVHGAKGLEFKYVFIVNLVDRRFPTIERREQIELPDELVKEIIPQGDIHLQEERRLFYVAMTRAKQGLFFTWAENYGGTRKKKPSRFLVEIDLIKKGGEKEIKSIKPSMIEEFKKKKSYSVSKQDQQAKFFRPPTRFSFTQLKAFETCPLQYKFQHILHIPVRGKWTFSFGKTIHNTLYKFFQRILEGQGKEQGSLFEKSHPTGGHPQGEKIKSLSPRSIGDQKSKLLISLPELLQIYEESWIDDWYLDKNQQKDYKEKGRKILKDFYEKILEEGLPAVKFLELPFNFKLEGYTIKGVIDRVDEIIPKELEIIDYKTGQSKEKEGLNLDDKEQLLIYQMAVNEIFKEKPAKLTFYYLENNQPVSFLGTEEELNKMKEKILKTIGEIKKGDFSPSPSAFKCKFCDFKDICEYRAV